MTRSEKEPGTGKSQGERISHSAISKGASELGKFVCVSGGRGQTSGSYFFPSLSRSILIMVRRGGQKSKDTLNQV